jgi:hypothetical protein
MIPSIHSINRAAVRHFVGLIKRFFKGRETLDPQVSSIHKTSVRPFGGLTIRFFKGHEILGWNIQNFRCATFRPFGGLKSIPAMSLNPPIQANWLYVNHCTTFSLLEKVFLQRVMRPSDKGYLAFNEIQLSIIATWIKDSLSVLKPSAQGYVADFKRINAIFVA